MKDEELRLLVTLGKLFEKEKTWELVLIKEDGVYGWRISYHVDDRVIAVSDEFSSMSEIKDMIENKGN